MNLTDSSPPELIFGRYEFVDESPAVAIPILMILVFASFIGTFGNILILITIIATKNLQRLECIFMANLAFSDMYVTLIADPLSIVVWAHLHPSFNWLVYYFTNTKFQAAFDRIAHLDKIFGRCRRGQSNEELSTSGGLQKADTSKQHHESSELSDITK
ncbi:unnamed protein product [Mytilus edulis]|uniref:G-protein coupled receptors family 1 profile domain-containing protein n=1 Tax=Mytilus edulis TaxID=6550 RepID=A0A8S3RZH2_MYTED|nr:unnamed protein product [Mytilus edulis]